MKDLYQGFLFKL